MYIDLIILLILLIVVVMFFKRFSSFVFFIAIIEITLRILTFIKDNIGLKDLSKVMDKYLPDNLFFIIDKYTGSIPTLCIILKWVLVGIMTMFLIYIIKIFIKKKKI